MATEGDSGSSPEPAHAATNPAAPCIAPECVNLADYGIVCGQHIQDGPLAHLNWATDRIRAHDTELANTRTSLETEIEEHILERDALKAEVARLKSAYELDCRTLQQAEAEVERLKAERNREIPETLFGLYSEIQDCLVYIKQLLSEIEKRTEASR